MNNSIKLSFILVGILSLVLFLYSFELMWKGIHNVDLSWNVCRMAGYYNDSCDNFQDYYDIDKSISIKDLYITGLKQIRISFYSALIFCFCLNYLMLKLIKGGVDGKRVRV